MGIFWNLMKLVHLMLFIYTYNTNKTSPNGQHKSGQIGCETNFRIDGCLHALIQSFHWLTSWCSHNGFGVDVFSDFKFGLIQKGVSILWSSRKDLIISTLVFKSNRKFIKIWTLCVTFEWLRIFNVCTWLIWHYVMVFEAKENVRNFLKNAFWNWLCM